MNLQNLLQHVDQKWHKDFIQFINTGEANKAFLDYLNHDQEAQKGVEKAFTAHVVALQGLAEELKSPSVSKELIKDPASSASNQFAQAVAGVLNLAPDQRAKVVKEAAASLVSPLQPQRQEEIVAFADDFRQNVADATK